MQTLSFASKLQHCSFLPQNKALTKASAKHIKSRSYSLQDLAAAIGVKWKTHTGEAEGPGWHLQEQ